MNTMKTQTTLEDERQELLDGLARSPQDEDAWSALISVARSDSEAGETDRSEFAQLITQQATASFRVRAQSARWGRRTIVAVSAMAAIVLFSVALPEFMGQQPSTLDSGVPEIAMTKPIEQEMVYYVAFNYNGLSEGTEIAPFNSLAEGLDSSEEGSILVLRGGSSAEVIRLSKAIRLEAKDGPVRIGIAPDKI